MLPAHKYRYMSECNTQFELDYKGHYAKYFKQTIYSMNFSNRFKGHTGAFTSSSSGDEAPQSKAERKHLLKVKLLFHRLNKIIQQSHFCSCSVHFERKRANSSQRCKNSLSFQASSLVWGLILCP